MNFLGNAAIKLPWFTRNVAGKPIGIFILVATIPICGAIIDWFLYPTAFERSGAILVSVAIFCVYLNHFVANDIESWEGIRQGTWKLGRSVEEILPQINRTFSEQDRLQTAVDLFNNIESANTEIKALGGVMHKIVQIEFLAGVSGTLIWGFGDLWDVLLRV